MSSRGVSGVGILVIVLAGAVAAIPTPSAWVERFYSRQVYLVSQNVLTPLSSRVSFAVFDLLVLAVLVGLAGWWFVALRAGRGRRWRAAGRMAFNTLAVVAAIYLIFLLAWGLNYRREPLTAKLDYDHARITAQALVDITIESVEHLNALYPRARQVGWATLDDVPVRLGPAFEQVQRRLGTARIAVPGDPKASLLTPYFRRAGIDGMINPFSLEILVNETVLPYERPLVVAHEWAHLAGYADESEASFIGWLTCLAGDDSSQYSAWLFLMPRLVRHLDERDRDQMWELLDSGPIDDLRAIDARLSQAVPVVQRNANRVYDRYLRAHGVGRRHRQLRRGRRPHHRDRAVVGPMTCRPNVMITPA